MLWNSQNSSVAQGKFEEALPLYDRCIEIREKVQGPDHPDLAANLNNKAMLLWTMVR